MRVPAKDERRGRSLELSALVEALSDPAPYPHRVDAVEVRHTHISVVFLTDRLVYKIKKPVELGFLDFTTLERRRWFCEEEVRLNRRLAPDVYLGIVPIVRYEGALLVDPRGPAASAGEVVEWAVLMSRLPEAHTLASWVRDGSLRPYHVTVLARRLASFHADAARGPSISAWGTFETVAGNARENLAQSLPHVGCTLSAQVHGRVSRALDRELERLEPVISGRAGRGVPCDTHGDLHLDHVYVFADRAPPDDIVIVDCIEFNERFRFADPVADIAFLDMDLRYHGRPDLARVLGEAYFEAAGDPEGRRLLRFYSAYRAAVRAKVAGFRALDSDLSDSDRAEAVASGRAHWLLALQLLEPPRRRPCLVLVGGLPGTGKSTLAEALSRAADFDVLSSDRTRKRLAGLAPHDSARADFGRGIYSDAWNDRTYEELLTATETRLQEGRRVLVDASFREDARRDAFLELAERLAVPARFLLLEAPPDGVRSRIAARAPGPSDADSTTQEEVARRWEAPSARTARNTRSVDTGQTPAWSVEQALAHLDDLGV